MTPPMPPTLESASSPQRIFNHQKDAEAMAATSALFLADTELTKKLPVKVDLRNSRDMPSVLNQGSLGSCTANAVCNAIRFCCDREKDMKWLPSRLFLYYNGRKAGGFDVSRDTGCSIPGILKGVVEDGVCTDQLWPYDIRVFTQQPSKEAYAQAIKPSSQFSRVALPKSLLKQCLASGYPISFGFAVYESFQSQKVAVTGKVPMPKGNEKYLGGHAVLMVGYDDRTSMFLVQNSWGEQWGQEGYFQLPYSYIFNDELTWDCWVVKRFL